MQRASDLPAVSIFIANKIIDRARSAMNELCKIGIAENNVWHQHREHRYEILDDFEYLKQFGCVDATLLEIVKLVEVGELQTLPSFDLCRNQNSMYTMEVFEQGLQIEASRDKALIKISPTKLVELLMDVNQWSTAFYNIVSGARILGSIEGSYDEKMHVMSAEFHLPSPVIPTRKCVFARYSKQFTHNIWAVVDVSLEDILQSPSNNFHKRPSGCLIEGMPDGNSKVIWLEHVEADYSKLSDLFRPLVTSALAFGATRWLTSIVRYIEWSETLKAPKLIADAGGMFIFLLQNFLKTFLDNLKVEEYLR
ncbi:putative START-like domain-containing protein [Medicago truncatula]|uniref:Putative START-like domain-containing protein n=1 Tax=Medicago truncatula TaxID=3880 RepID=A0A396JAW4_MEDTR|nr:putative START-like domain-containing protein [Medicago truncatula]